MKRRTIGIAVTGIVLFGCGRGEHVGSSSQPILNEAVVESEDSVELPAVSINGSVPGITLFAAGSLIGPKAILTAAHSFTEFPVTFPVDKLTVSWANASPRPAVACD